MLLNTYSLVVFFCFSKFCNWGRCMMSRGSHCPWSHCNNVNFNMVGPQNKHWLVNTFIYHTYVVRYILLAFETISGSNQMFLRYVQRNIHNSICSVWTKIRYPQQSRFFDKITCPVRRTHHPWLFCLFLMVLKLHLLKQGFSLPLVYSSSVDKR